MKARITILGISLALTVAFVAFYNARVREWNRPLNGQGLLDRRSEEAKTPLRVTEITLERKGSLLGESYKIRFTKDPTIPFGEAWYVGKRHVDKIGNYYGQCPDFNRLAAWIEMQHFENFDNEYNFGAAEAQTVTTTVVIGGVRKSIVNYAAGGGPLELWMIESAIDGVAANIRWKKQDDPRNSP